MNRSNRSLLMSICLPQDVLDDFSAAEGDLFAVLRKSYDLLPSKKHRLMFLDAALMLRGRPAAHLVALWEGALLHYSDTEKCQDLLPYRTYTESFADWQGRRRAAAAATARKYLNYLLDLSLVGVEGSDASNTHAQR